MSACLSPLVWRLVCVTCWPRTLESHHFSDDGQGPPGERDPGQGGTVLGSPETSSCGRRRRWRGGPWLSVSGEVGFNCEERWGRRLWVVEEDSVR